MPFARYPANVTLDIVNRERLRDVRTIEQIEQGKRNYRNRNQGPAPRVAAPSAHDDLQQGDIVGDEYLDATYRYLLVDDPIDGVLWERFLRGDTTW